MPSCCALISDPPRLGKDLSRELSWVKGRIKKPPSRDRLRARAAAPGRATRYWMFVPGSTEIAVVVSGSKVTSTVSPAFHGPTSMVRGNVNTWLLSRVIVRAVGSIALILPFTCVAFSNALFVRQGETPVPRARKRKFRRGSSSNLRSQGAPLRSALLGGTSIFFLRGNSEGAACAPLQGRWRDGC